MATTVFAATGSGYYSVDQFLVRNPEQREIMNAFSKGVHNEVVKSDKTEYLKDVKISFLYPGIQVSDYWKRSTDSFTARLDEYGVEFEIGKFFMRPTEGLRTQMKHLEHALESDPDYLVFTLDVRRHLKMIEPILIKGRPKLILQNITTPLIELKGRQPFLYVGFDHVTGSRMLADYYIKKTGGVGSYGAVLPRRGYLSQMRGDSFIDYVSNKSELKIAARYYSGIDRQKARKATLDMVRVNPDLKFIYAASTDIAFGVLDGLKEAGMEDKGVLVNGWGGGSAELEAIEAGKLSVTVMRINDDNGVAMADAVIKDIRGQAKEVPVVYSGGFALVQKGISKQLLNKLKQNAFRYSGM
ncbi:MAG: substrate-binding domain-containing protein [Desulfovibrio sp.]